MNILRITKTNTRDFSFEINDESAYLSDFGDYDPDTEVFIPAAPSNLRGAMNRFGITRGEAIFIQRTIVEERKDYPKTLKATVTLIPLTDVNVRSASLNTFN